MILATRHTHFHVQVIERGKVTFEQKFSAKDHSKAIKLFELQSNAPMIQFRGRKVNLKRCEVSKKICGVK